jgi:uncharacterized delta-60 repeat protein
LDDGGSTVTQYTVTSDPDELTVTARGFDAGLKTITDFGAGDDKGYAMATLDDGKILVGGYAYNGTDDDFALARYDSDGTLDTTFGSSGRTITDFGYGLDVIRALTVLDSGKILVAGYAYNGTDSDFALARYDADGTLDTTFGSSGRTITDFGYGTDLILAMTVLDSGKILVAGNAYNGTDDDFALARYDADGTLDTTFGSSGRTITDFGYGSDGAYALTILDSGGILAGGISDNGSDYDFALARYSSDGNLDTTFGSGGKTTTDFGYGPDLISAMTVLDSGKILVAGYAYNGTDADFALARYDADGTLNSTFGSGGKTTTDFGYGTEVILAMTVLDSGKILVAGYAYNGTDADFALARYDADGSLDTSFGSGGKTTTGFSDSTDKIFEVAVRGDGKLVVAGYAHNGSDYDFALARYNQDGGLDPGLTSVVTGLSNGTSYTFTVTATNAVGTGDVSAPSAAVTPTGPPDPPTGVTAVGGVGQATVSWIAPASDGGSPVTSYNVTSTPGDLTASVGGAVLSAIVTGLTNGTPYTFRVGASNAVGASAPSARSATTTPKGPPLAPTNISAVPGNAEATVNWSAPASDGGSAILLYNIVSSPDGLSKAVNGTDLTGVVTGLTNGAPYTFTVTALNALGASPPSTTSASVVPGSVPGPPTNVRAVAGDETATVTWEAPAVDGGRPILQYNVSSTPDGIVTTVSATTSAATVTGLTNFVAYTFTVVAVNTVGAGPASTPSNEITPPNEPPEVTASTDTSGDEGELLSLQLASFTDSDVVDTHIASIDWGDGATSTAAVTESGGSGTISASHIYADDGTYTVTVTVTDSFRSTEAVSFTLTVDNVAPTVLAGGLQTTAGTSTTLPSIHFTDLGIQDTHTASIDWGDGATSTALVNASSRLVGGSHTYSSTGQFTVTVTVTDNAGDSGSGVLTIDVTSAPVAVNLPSLSTWGLVAMAMALVAAFAVRRRSFDRLRMRGDQGSE